MNMNAFFAAGCGFALIINAGAATTILNAHKHAHGANIGWVNAQGDVANGAVIGASVCSGFLWSANVGWIHLGDGSPADGMQYRNNSAADFGVNLDEVGNLRGFAYGANIGWVNFENHGAPRIDLLSGVLSGHAYSANCGWISLSNAFAFVQTDRLPPGTDTDGDGIPDAWELTYTNSLSQFTATSDTDGDGASDLNEHGADTHPLDAADHLRIKNFSVVANGGAKTGMLTWFSKPTRSYQVHYRTSLSPASIWQDAIGPIEPGPGTTTSAVVPFSPPLLERYFRVQALKPPEP